MKIYINKKEKIYTDGIALIDILLDNEEFNNGIAPIALNGKLIFASEYSKIIVKANDEIRIFPVAMGG